MIAQQIPRQREQSVEGHEAMGQQAFAKSPGEGGQCLQQSQRGSVVGQGKPAHEAQRLFGQPLEQVRRDPFELLVRLRWILAFDPRRELVGSRNARLKIVEPLIDQCAERATRLDEEGGGSRGHALGTL
jgi:hypothetical protein